MKLAHLSDLHFQIDVSLSPFGPLDLRQWYARAEFVLQGRPALFREAPATVARLLADADAAGAEHLLISGDLSAISLRAELEAARRALARFAGRTTVIPGNHDRTSRASASGFEAVFAEELRSDLPELCSEGPYPLVRLVGLDQAIVGLDSGRVPTLPGVARGWVGPVQLAALERILAHPRVEGRTVTVAVHHAPFRPDGAPDGLTHGLRDAAALLAILDAHGVAALCHGHIHHRFATRRSSGTPIFGAGSSTQRGREGYWLLDLLDRTCSEERRDLPWA